MSAPTPPTYDNDTEKVAANYDNDKEKRRPSVFADGVEADVEGFTALLAEGASLDILPSAF
jgi:hypothetical protein